MPTLSAPRLLTFLVSAVLIGLAVASLYTRIPMVEIAGRTGFSSAATFSRAFSRAFGQAPAQVRRR